MARTVKPALWHPRILRVAPEWRWIYRDIGSIWPLWERGGLNTWDYGPHRRTAAFQNIDLADWIDHQFGACVDLDGVDERISIADPYPVGNGAQFTLAVLFRETGVATITRQIYTESRDSANNGKTSLFLNVASPSRFLRFRHNNDAATAGVATGVTDVTPDVWHTGVGIERSSALREVWLDGKFEGSNTNSITAPTTIDQATIGAVKETGGTFDHFPGQIALVVTHRRGWLPKEIAQFNTDPFGFLRPARRVMVQVSQIAGTVAGTFPMLTGALTGTVAVTGEVAGTFPMLVGAFTGTVAVTGTAAATFPMLVGAFDGTVAVAGEVAATFPMLVGAFTGTVAVTGTAAGTFPMLVGVFDGIVGSAPVTGDFAATLPMLTGSFVGDVAITGVTVGTFPMLVGAFTGTVAVTGVAAGLFPMLVGAFTGTVAAPAGVGFRVRGVLSVRPVVQGALEVSPVVRGMLSIQPVVGS